MIMISILPAINWTCPTLPVIMTLNSCPCLCCAARLGVSHCTIATTSYPLHCTTYHILPYYIPSLILFLHASVETSSQQVVLLTHTDHGFEKAPHTYKFIEGISQWNNSTEQKLIFLKFFSSTNRKSCYKVTQSKISLDWKYTNAFMTLLRVSSAFEWDNFEGNQRGGSEMSNSEHSHWNTWGYAYRKRVLTLLKHVLRVCRNFVKGIFKK